MHNSSTHLTFNKFWRRYGKFSRHLMKIKLKKYTKFLFVRDPFVRLISAFRSKFELENEEFYQKFAVPMLKRYSNHTSLPASVSEAFSAGLRLSFATFIQYLLDPHTEQLAPFNEHWRQVHRLCHPCQIDYDFVGKLETLDQDAAQLLRLLKVDKLLQFPRVTGTGLPAAGRKAGLPKSPGLEAAALQTVRSRFCSLRLPQARKST